MDLSPQYDGQDVGARSIHLYEQGDTTTELDGSQLSTNNGNYSEDLQSEVKCLKLYFSAIIAFEMKHT